jgi:flap endonuclease-1
MEPDKTQYEIKFGKPDSEKIKRLMCDEHDFSEERIDNALNKLEEKKGEQKSLSRWLKK